LYSPSRLLDLRRAALAHEVGVARQPLEPGTQRVAREPRVSQHTEVRRVPAAGCLKTERGIADKRDGDAQHGVDLADRDALGGGRDLREVDAGPFRNPDRVESVQLQEPPEHLAHRGKAGVTSAVAGASHSAWILHPDPPRPILACPVNELA